MQTDPKISFHNLDASPAVAEIVMRRIAVLERLHPRLIGCEVRLDAPQKHKRHGRVVRAHVTLHVPGPDIHAERSIAQGSARGDPRLAVNRAFAAIERHLKRVKKTMAALEVKHHEPILHGEIISIEPELGFGFVRADDGREVYFQRDSLCNGDWNALRLGARLRFREFHGEKGPYAVHVSVADPR